VPAGGKRRQRELRVDVGRAQRIYGAKCLATGIPHYYSVVCVMKSVYINPLHLSIASVRYMRALRVRATLIGLDIY